jgi:hypothetical protein
MRRNRRPRPPSSRPQSRGEPDLPALTELERFTQGSLHEWLGAKSNLDAIQRALYFELEPLRQRNEARLLEALRSQALPAFAFEGWSRIVDYRYGLEPLSVAGSLRGDGGRFNIGNELSPGAFTAFPALYIAEDYEAAFRERFGGPSTPRAGGLSAQELALRSPRSFTQVRLRGHIENLIDVGQLDALRPFATVHDSCCTRIGECFHSSSICRPTPRYSDGLRRPQVSTGFFIRRLVRQKSVALRCFPRTGPTAAHSWKSPIRRLRERD